MKHQELKARLIKQTLAIGGLLIGLAVIIGGLLMLSDDFQQANDTLKNDVAALTAEGNTLQEKYTKVQQNISLYQEAMARSEAGRLTINHQSVGDSFNRLNDKFYLSNLHLTMSGINEVKSADFKSKNAVIVSSEVSVTFQAISDEYVYWMLDQMQQDLAGSARLTKLTLKRGGPVTDEVLHGIIQKGTFALVNAEMKFLWFGVKPVDAKAPDADATKQKN